MNEALRDSIIATVDTGCARSIVVESSKYCGFIVEEEISDMLQDGTLAEDVDNPGFLIVSAFNPRMSANYRWLKKYGHLNENDTIILVRGDEKITAKIGVVSQQGFIEVGNPKRGEFKAVVGNSDYTEFYDLAEWEIIEHIPDCGSTNESR